MKVCIHGVPQGVNRFRGVVCPDMPDSPAPAYHQSELCDFFSSLPADWAFLNGEMRIR